METVSKPKYKVSEEEIKTAMQVNILDLALSQGIDVEKSSANEYRLVEDHSVAINTRKNIFNDFATNERAGNAINFAQKYLGYEKFTDAVNFLNATDIERVEWSEKDQSSLAFSYDYERESSSFNPSKDYLTKERKINPMLVRYLYEKKYLSQNEFQSEKMKEAKIPPHTNLVMKWKYDDKIVGATEQGVHANELYKRNAWKGIQENSKTNHGFNFMIGKPKNIYFFESGIDAMSFASLKMMKEKKGIASLKDSWFVSMEGLKQNTIIPHATMAFEKLNEGKTEQDQKEAPNLFICIDSDEPANEFYSSLAYTEDSMPRLSPECPYEGEEDMKWDWNDELKEQKEFINLLEQQRIRRAGEKAIER